MPRNTAFGNPTVHPDEDEFNRWPFSRALADRIANLGSPEGAAVIGLYGRWGYGKSSVLNFIKYRLREEHSGRAILLGFNPWLFNDRESLLIGFYAKLAKELGIALKGTRHKIGKTLADFGGAFSAVPLVGSGLKSIAEALGKKLADNPIENQREQIKEAMADAPKIVVVLIDDLDRLERDEIVLMLKLVRLTGDIPNVVYVLCFDDEMIAQAVRSYYGDSPEAGRQFIEKIVQFPFVIPAVGQDRMIEYALKHARSAATSAGLGINDDGWAAFRDLITHCLLHRLTTPRQAIRYGSALDFALPILKGEVDPLEQMTIEGIRILYPELYAYMRDHDRVFTRDGSDRSRFHLDEKELADHARQALKGCAEEEMNAAAGLLNFLFRRPDVPQSVGDPRYFQRHFGYALARDEITDAEMAALLSHAETGNDRLGALVQELAERNPDQLITMLRNARPSGNVCVELSRVLATSGAFFVKSRPLKDDVQAKKLGDLLAELVRRVRLPSSYGRAGARERHELAALVLRSVEPLALAPVLVESLSQLNSQIRLNRDLGDLVSLDGAYTRPESRPTDGSDLVITDEGWAVLVGAFVPRVRDFLTRERTEVFEKGTDANALFDLWERHDRRTLKDWIEPRIQAEPAFALGLLRQFTTDPGSRELGNWSYRCTCAVASPTIIQAALRKQFGDVLSDENEHGVDVGLGRSFLREHELAIAKAEAEREHDGNQDEAANKTSGARPG